MRPIELLLGETISFAIVQLFQERLLQVKEPEIYTELQCILGSLLIRLMIIFLLFCLSRKNCITKTNDKIDNENC